MKRMDFALGERDIIEIVRIITDCDQRGALAFLSSHLKSLSRGMMPGTEALYSKAKICDIIVKGDLAKTLEKMVRQEDEEGCLAFLRANFEREIKKALTPCCVPVFEASYKPNQAEHYATNADCRRPA